MSKKSSRSHDLDPRQLDERGLATRREVLGGSYVDDALERATAFDAPFQELITAHAWGDVWSRPELDRPTRSLVTIALLAALGHERELGLHLRASRRTGATAEQVRETLLHVAIYAGVPAANTAFAVARRVLSDVSENGGDDSPEEG